MLVIVLQPTEACSLQMLLFDLDDWFASALNEILFPSRFGQVVIVACKTFSFPITALFRTDKLALMFLIVNCEY